MPATDINEEYIKAINAQRSYLAILQKAFDEHCLEITKLAKEKLDHVQESDTEKRQEILEHQKKQLTESLNKFKLEIASSNTKTRKILENLHSKREKTKLSELESLIMNSE